MNNTDIPHLNWIQAYACGAFPMAKSVDATSLSFYSADPHALIPLDDNFKIRRSLRKELKKERFILTHDKAFAQVIQACAEVSRQEGGTWINGQIQQVFVDWHAAGIAHSVEAWHNDQLVGGIYGLALGGVFCGESMFSTHSFASQYALVELVNELNRQEFKYFDAQIGNSHTEQFGLQHVPLSHWQEKLLVAAQYYTPWGKKWFLQNDEILLSDKIKP